MSVFDHIIAMVEPGSTVLDLGCDDGTLLKRLAQEKQVIGRGVDIDDRSIQECIRKGISVFHGDLDEGLKDHPSGSYDYVILSRTLQQVRNPAHLLEEIIRVGRRGIVNYPNFAYLLNRFQLGLGGRMPVNRNIPYSWHNTPNIHFFTHKDFRELCREKHIRITKELFLHRKNPIPPLWPNLLATDVCCLIQR
ncbi:methionine biosynthesis protein MetW [Alkalispirochaeta americana]|uniref:Methionine biosynthesis protein MetW n=1 Tax=Alkalispirochaeta americana TaxID=159291 RepID=A0A1N6WER5_9SPIO|nr:methionine biosynthesis protein MetW [Alkalispirochaeta americana]SIQ88643.1 methionine biosynthesis protein MetW [Alkalispirochaeta americana]